MVDKGEIKAVIELDGQDHVLNIWALTSGEGVDPTAHPLKYIIYCMIKS